jgi:hypothetical protein
MVVREPPMISEVLGHIHALRKPASSVGQIGQLWNTAPADSQIDDNPQSYDEAFVFVFTITLSASGLRPFIPKG